MQHVSILQLKTLADKLDIPVTSLIKYTEEAITENKLTNCILVKDQAIVIKIKPSLIKFIENNTISLNDLSNTLKLNKNTVRALLEHIKKEKFIHFYYSKDRERIIGEKALLNRILQELRKNNFIVDLSQIFQDITISNKDISKLIEKAVNIYDKSIYLKIKGTKLLLAGYRVKHSIQSYIEKILKERNEIHIKEFSEFEDFKPLMNIIEKILAEQGYIRYGNKYVKYEVVLEELKKELEEKGIIHLEVFSKERTIDLNYLEPLLETICKENSTVYLKKEKVLIHKPVFSEKIKQYIKPYSRVPIKVLAENFSLSIKSIEEILLEFIRENLINAKLDPIKEYLINMDIAQIPLEVTSPPIDVARINSLKSKVSRLIEKVKSW